MIKLKKKRRRKKLLNRNLFQTQTINHDNNITSNDYNAISMIAIVEIKQNYKIVYQIWICERLMMIEEIWRNGEKKLIIDEGGLAFGVTKRAKTFTWTSSVMGSVWKHDYFILTLIKGSAWASFKFIPLASVAMFNLLLNKPL